MKKLFSIILTSIALTSCVDTVILPDNLTVDEDFWQKKSEVDAVVATAYAQLRNEAAIRNMIVWGDFRSDELVVSSSLSVSADYKVDLSQIYSLNIETENAFTTWYPFYSAINYCNLVLDKAEGVVAVDPDYTRGDYEANKAQMLALRAFCYFYLTRVFHDIPVTPGAYLNSSDDLNAPQATPDSVLTMCINDLEEASKYAISGSVYGDWRDKGYLNQDGINAILADIYLWRASVNRDANDYEACVAYCDKVIQAKKVAYESSSHVSNRRPGAGGANTEQDYYLSDNENMYDDLWGTTETGGQNADESIFELQYKVSDVNNTGLDQMYFRYKNASANSTGYLKASSIFGLVDPTGQGVWNNAVDQRLFEVVYNANDSKYDQFDVRKMVAQISAYQTAREQIKVADNTRSGRADMRQNWIFYRLTDVMLMKAEALVQLYKLGGEAEDDTRNLEAYNICKFVNDRALSEADRASYSLKQGDDMELVVLAERARELCFEGKRWFDLMRYNYRHTEEKADLTKKLTDGYVMNSDVFFGLALRKYTVPASMRAKMRDERYLYMPINQTEIDVNPNLVQNPVYQSSSKY